MKCILIIFLTLLFYPVVSFGVNESAINVQKYGAIPNDGIDDRAAIQRAIDAVKNNSVTTLVPLYHSNQVVYFPPGRYDITGSLVVPQRVEQLKGDGAMLYQSSNTADTLTSVQFLQVTISGLKFIGGRHAIKFSNNNLDTSKLTITDCEFSNTLDYAIFVFNSPSTLLTVKESRFISVSKVLHTSSDWSVFKDSWVTIFGSPDGDNVWINRSTDPDSLCNDATKLAGGVFCNSNTLIIENLLGVPIIGSRAERPRWIDNMNGIVYANHSRFGGESGGMPIVYDYGVEPTIFYGQAPRFIIIENSATCGGAAGGDPDGTDATDSAIVNIRGSVPRLIRLIGNTCITDHPYIRAGSVDLAAFFLQFTTPVDYRPLERVWKIEIEPNNYAPGAEQYTIPAELFPYVIKGRNVFGSNGGYGGGENHTTRTITAAGAVTVTKADHTIIVNKGTGAATTVNLPANPVQGETYVIADGKFDATANNITITPAAGTIENAATYVMNVNGQSATIVYTGTAWKVI